MTDGVAETVAAVMGGDLTVGVTIPVNREGSREGTREGSRADLATCEQLEAASELVALIRAAPDRTAAQLAGSLDGRCPKRAGMWNARRVRELIWIARARLHCPVIGVLGGGYRLAGSLAEAAAYAESARRIGRDYMALAARVTEAAERRFSGQGELATAGQATAAES